jgi:hypothetical protein
MSEPDGNRGGWRWPLLAAALALAPHLSVMLGRTELFYDDHRRFSVPVAAQAAQAICRGELPAWNPYAGVGAPLLADPQSLALHPGLRLACLLPVSHALGLLFVLHLGLLAAGLTVLLRALGARAGVAVGVGAAAALCGPAPSWLTSGPYLITLSFFPWTILAAWRLGQAEKQQIPPALLLALALGLALRGGDIPGALCQAAVAVVVWASAGRRGAAALVGAGALALLIGVAAWLPLFWYLGRSVRAGGLSTAEAGRWSFHPAELVGFFAPHPAGLPLPENTFWPFGWVKQPRLFVHSYYVSALLAGAAVWAAVALRRDRLVRALLGSAAVLLLVATGSTTPLWRVLSVVFTFLRYPSKVAPYAVVLLAVAGGLGLSALLERPRTRALAVLAALVGLGALLLPPLQSHLARAAGAEPEQIAMAAAQLRAGTLAAAALAALAAAVLFLRGRVPLLERHAPAVLGAILVADAATAGSALWWTVPAPLLTPRPAWLASSSPAGPRVIRAGELDRMMLHRDQVGYLTGLQRNERLLQPNSNVLLGAGNLEPYGLALGDLHQALGGLYHRDPTTLAEITGADFLLVPSSSMQRWVAEGLGRGRLQVVAALPEDGAVVLRPTQPLPRAYTTTEFRLAAPRDELSALAEGLVIRDGEALEGGRRRPGAVTLPPSHAGAPVAAAPAAWAPAALRFELTLERPSLLVISDAFADGWHASVDGAEVPIYRANIVGRAVAVPAGAHAVAMWFDVPLFRWAARLPPVGLGLAFLALLFHLRRRPE